MNFNDPDLISKVIEFEHDSLKRKRFEHCVRVAETSRYMSELYGCDIHKAYFAGLVHDICKYMTEEEMIDLAKQDGNPISELEKNNFNLLHGRAGAVLIQQKFNITDQEIIKAVAKHTYGDENLTDLQKIIFAADKIEPGRPNVTDEDRKRLFGRTLDEICLEIVQEEIRYVESKGRTIAPETFRFVEDLKKGLLIKEGA